MPQLAYVPLERLKVRPPVDRTKYIVERCRGRKVLDLGCYDETAAVKFGTRHWLHGEISKVAYSVTGVDNSEQIPEVGLQTGQNSRILRGDVTRLEEFARSCEVETIVAGELLEHLAHPLEFLTDLHALFPGCELVLSTPNATSLTNATLALAQRESSHCDHLQVFSYKTLNSLCLRAGFADFEIIPYHVRFTELALRSSGLQRTLVAGAEQLVNFGERLFPLLSGGLILYVSHI